MSQHPPAFTVDKVFPRDEAAPGIDLPDRQVVSAPPLATAPLASSPRRRRAGAGCARSCSPRRHSPCLAQQPILAGTIGRSGASRSRPTTPMSRPTTPRSRRRSPAISPPCPWATTSRSSRGQVLARIDDRDFKVALDQAKADVAAAEAAVAEQAGRPRRPAVGHRRGPGDASTSTRPTRPSPSRTTSATPHLATTGYGSVQNAQQAASRIAAARAAVARDTAALATAAKQVDVLKAELAQAQATARPRRGRAATRPS